MRSSNKLRSLCEYPFTHITYSNLPTLSDRYSIICNPKSSLYKLSVKVDLEGPELEVPVFCRNTIENIIRREISLDNKTKDIFIALAPREDLNIVGTTNTAISKAFNTHTRVIEIMKSGYPKYYYGGKGFLIDGNYNPLLFYVLHGAYGNENLIEYKTARVYINPLVFESDGPLEKYIVKSVIPTLASIEMRVGSTASIMSTRSLYHIVTDRFGGYEKRYKKADIIISDDINKFFVKPTPPKSINTFEKDLNEFIHDHAEDISKSALVESLR